jgi:hypothetical protein
VVATNSNYDYAENNMHVYLNGETTYLSKLYRNFKF